MVHLDLLGFGLGVRKNTQAQVVVGTMFLLDSRLFEVCRSAFGSNMIWHWSGLYAVSTGVWYRMNCVAFCLRFVTGLCIGDSSPNAVGLRKLVGIWQKDAWFKRLAWIYPCVHIRCPKLLYIYIYIYIHIYIHTYARSEYALSTAWMHRQGLW